MTEKQAAGIFKALSDENRIRILKLLRDGERCACRILEELNITQPTLSHHMKILCDSGLVKARKEGKWMHYSICCEGASIAGKILLTLTSPGNIPAECGCSSKEEPK